MHFSLPAQSLSKCRIHLPIPKSTFVVLTTHVVLWLTMDHTCMCTYMFICIFNFFFCKLLVKFSPAIMHPVVTMATEAHTGRDGSPLPKMHVPNSSTTRGLQRLIRPYIGMFIPTAKKSAIMKPWILSKLDKTNYIPVRMNGERWKERLFSDIMSIYSV